MATALVRLRCGVGALRGGARASTRNLASNSSPHHHNAHENHEMAKWEKITYLGIATCTVFAIYNLSKGHPHYEEPPPYEYLHIRNKDFPWGPDGLFEVKRR
ncbi:Cytochrome c oxidase, subunit VIa superfamily [Sesbania bispinosa]|nr:Cytochrome c oxidase, subunit VIa superfamily [Sesbania bispinosa]